MSCLPPAVLAPTFYREKGTGRPFPTVPSTTNYDPASRQLPSGCSQDSKSADTAKYRGRDLLKAVVTQAPVKGN